MPNPATPHTKKAIGEFAKTLPFHDKRDYEDIERGFIATAAERKVLAKDGHVVWDLDAYSFLAGHECPDSANPSLWRQGQLNVKDGLFEVVPGIYQLRGHDISCMSIIEGKTGVIVVDPLLCNETAAAAWALYCEHRGKKPVHAMIYTHSHVSRNLFGRALYRAGIHLITLPLSDDQIDHFGGVKGVITQEDVDSGKTQVIAPEGFMEHAVVENVYAGTAMARRAGYMYGAAVDKGPDGQIGAGLGQTTPMNGEATLIAPTLDITHTGQEVDIDGVKIIFQITPGTEAPAEMNLWVPRRDPIRYLRQIISHPAFVSSSLRSLRAATSLNSRPSAPPKMPATPSTTSSPSAVPSSATPTPGDII